MGRSAEDARVEGYSALRGKDTIMRIHFIVHEAFEAPGVYEQWAVQRGHDVTYSRVYQGEPLPRAEDVDWLIIMGGPQSPTTTTDECPHFDSRAEQVIIRQAIAADKCVIGVCLGAQLMGQALGGECERSPHKEIGSFPIWLTKEGESDPVAAAMFDDVSGQELTVGHWHGDMPGLTHDAVVLAMSEGCPRQIIRFAPRAYALQCHPELTAEVVRLLVDASTEELRQGCDEPFVDAPEDLLSAEYSEMNAALFRFLDALVAHR